MGWILGLVRGVAGLRWMVGKGHKGSQSLRGWGGAGNLAGLGLLSKLENCGPGNEETYIYIIEKIPSRCN